MKKVKRILDSVHGTIFVEDWFFRFIDTPAFQRLRRVEQTSTRSIFPSARHDRFVHSLGVFHIGSEIVNQLRTEVGGLKGLKNDKNNEDIEKLFWSYKVACLLHDVGHSPFSHTFEWYFGDPEGLCKKLGEVLNVQRFCDDVEGLILYDEKNLPKPHECTSAILCCMSPLVDIIKKKNLDLELIVRMITGIKYSDATGLDSLKNCFIELLHGEIDADRIDYACRDTWAAGYSTTKVDAKSLVSCIHIRENLDEKDTYCVCFDKRAISDIENVFGVKNFQSLHVFNHHTVVYEQYLLDKAVRIMAKNHYNCCEDSAMRTIFNIDNLGEHKDSEFKYLCDDDIIVELKKYNNIYYKEWSSRDYKKIALWKSYEDFMYILRDVPKPLKEIDKDAFKAKIEDELKNSIKEFNYPESEQEYERYYIKYMEMKAQVDFSRLYILIGNNVIKYDNLFSNDKDVTTLAFPYVFVEVPENYKDDREEFRRKMLDKLIDTIKSFYTN